MFKFLLKYLNNNSNNNNNNSVEQRPTEKLNTSTCNQVIFYISNFHFRLHNSPLFVAVQSQMSPVHILLSYFI